MGPKKRGSGRGGSSKPAKGRGKGKSLSQSESVEIENDESTSPKSRGISFDVDPAADAEPQEQSPTTSAANDTEGRGSGRGRGRGAGTSKVGKGRGSRNKISFLSEEKDEPPAADQSKNIAALDKEAAPGILRTAQEKSPETKRKMIRGISFAEEDPPPASDDATKTAAKKKKLKAMFSVDEPEIISSNSIDEEISISSESSSTPVDKPKQKSGARKGGKKQGAKKGQKKVAMSTTAKPSADDDEGDVEDKTTASTSSMSKKARFEVVESSTDVDSAPAKPKLEPDQAGPTLTPERVKKIQRDGTNVDDKAAVRKFVDSVLESALQKASKDPSITSKSRFSRGLVFKDPLSLLKARPPKVPQKQKIVRKRTAKKKKSKWQKVKTTLLPCLMTDDLDDVSLTSVETTEDCLDGLFQLMFGPDCYNSDEEDDIIEDEFYTAQEEVDQYLCEELSPEEQEFKIMFAIIRHVHNYRNYFRLTVK